MMFQKIYSKYGNFLKENLPIYSWVIVKNEFCIHVPVKYLYPIIFFLNKHSLCKYNILTDIICIDYPSRGTFRFEVVYQLLSTHYNSRIKIKVSIPDNTPIPSVTKIFPNACWSEREVFDMFGVFFENHPDLRRILTDYGFEGHPFRKDFPIQGFKEIRYDSVKKRITYNSLEFDQFKSTF